MCVTFAISNVICREMFDRKIKAISGSDILCPYVNFFVVALFELFYVLRIIICKVF